MEAFLDFQAHGARYQNRLLIFSRALIGADKRRCIPLGLVDAFVKDPTRRNKIVNCKLDLSGFDFTVILIHPNDQLPGLYQCMQEDRIPFIRIPFHNEYLCYKVNHGKGV